MPFRETGISGLLVYEPKVFEDPRGYFFESFRKELFQEAGIDSDWIQDNQSSSVYGVVRGLHFQLNPFAQAKLVRAIAGTILDVAVDLRSGSPTYGNVYTIELSAQNKLQLVIPRGFAHGFSVLSERAEVLYKCDNFYSKLHEGGLMYNDPELAIDWMIPEDKIVLSDKDRLHPGLQDCKHNFVFESLTT